MPHKYFYKYLHLVDENSLDREIMQLSQVHTQEGCCPL